MRPIIGIVVLVAAAVGLALFASHLHPGGELPPLEVEAETNRAEAEARQKASEERRNKIDHSPEAFEKVAGGAVHAQLIFQGKPPISIEFYPLAAPKTVSHIVDLVKQGFYTGIKVHRVESGVAGPQGQRGLKLFQFGDPLSVNTDPANFQTNHIGANGTGNFVPLEVRLPHAKYSIGLARSADVDSGDCQMYVNTDDNSVIDGEYCIFGRVVGGQDVCDGIKVGDTIKSFALKL